MASNLASPGAVSTELQRLAHYREQAAKFRKWAENETAPETGDGLRDVARQYEWLASENPFRCVADVTPRPSRKFANRVGQPGLPVTGRTMALGDALRSPGPLRGRPLRIGVMRRRHSNVG
jgi:hypothetical protein